MAEPDKQHVGDGGDNYGQAVQKTAEAIKKAGTAAAEKATATGAEAAANAAAASVQAGVQTGAAVSEVAAGTAAGGPVGAAIAAVWALRHTLFKILICICLLLLFIITAVISLPSVVFNNIFHTDPDTVEVGGPTDMFDIYDGLANAVNQCVSSGYDHALAEVERIIEEGGYDYEVSMESLINYGHASADYDIAYVLAAYSASMEQKGTTKADMVQKLNAVAKDMFRVTFEEKEFERPIPLEYATYKPISVTVITGKTQIGSVNGVPQYHYTAGSRTYYEPDASETTSEPITRTAYQAVSVEVPVYSGSTIVSTRSESYYEPAGSEMLTPETETVKYAECTIHPFDQSVILRAFGIDPGATYSQFNITYEEAIRHMGSALKLTLYGAIGSGDVPPLTDAELIAFLDGLECSATRKELIRVALTLVGRVPYFWGGKSAPGWNDQWNTPKLVTAAGSSSTGTLRPYGLDCSGFTDWVYKTALGKGLAAGSSGQWSASTEITESELLPGDLGFMGAPGEVDINHVLIYAGKDASGQQVWVHCSSSAGGVVLNSPGYVKYYRRPNGYDLENDTLPTSNTPGAVLYTLAVEVTHYCPCSKCCGKWAGGPTASGKMPQPGMVAMSSHYPFGTLIMINGTMYTVEDRGGSGIENDISRVDIFVRDHQQALRLGRYTTEAQIYKIGR